MATTRDTDAMTQGVEQHAEISAATCWYTPRAGTSDGGCQLECGRNDEDPTRDRLNCVTGSRDNPTNLVPRDITVPSLKLHHTKTRTLPREQDGTIRSSADTPKNCPERGL
jgi:hypothetical protein